MPYSHRNGEKETPTEPGVYWYWGGIDFAAGQVLYKGKITIYEDAEGELCAMEWPADDLGAMTGIAGSWWGPCVPPWDVTP